MQAELVEVAKRRLSFTANVFDLLREKSDELEAEADMIRLQLGRAPAPGRPPRIGSAGWALVAGSAVVIVAALWLFVR
ncbi:hypothetical protein RAC69_11560 [Microbacterium sp. LS_15]|uniref:hypothetical protein n=1 Tax=Microbacterium sp. LS_15 TaxID=3055790 RepID=UPI0035BF07DD